MNVKFSWIVLSGLVAVTRPASADLFHSPKFMSPAGKYEVILASAGSTSLPISRGSSEPNPPGQKAQYELLFYAAGSSDPVNADFYTDADPPASAEEIASSLSWSPNEQCVVVTHGLHAKTSGGHRWLVSLKRLGVYGFDGEHLRWVDDGRLVADLQTRKIPGGVVLLYTDKGRGELLVTPQVGIGYAIATVTDHRVTVKEYLNHWGDSHEITTWETFIPACFDVDLDTMKKRSVACPPAP